MVIFNHRAVYVRCDGAMDYDSKNTGGVGFVIEFPENMDKECIEKVIGRYEYANIERLELDAILQGMTELLKIFNEENNVFSDVNTIIIVTDRYALNDNQRTNPYRLREYRKNGWKNHEGKPIKNKDLLDKVDKIRKKLSDNMKSSVIIEYQPRKQNKVADKLAKAGKKKLVVNKSIAKNGMKIGRRRFDGDEINYARLCEKTELIVHIFKKELVSDQWEISVDIIDSGQKMKIYVDKDLEKKLHRHHIYKIKIKKVYTYHIGILRTIKEIKK